MTNYSVASGDGTICSIGFQALETAKVRAQEIADQTGDTATIQSDDGEEWTISPSTEVSR